MDRRRSLFLAAVLIGLAVCVVSVQAACEKGCDCLTPAEAKKLGYEYCGGVRTSCGTDLLPKYCYGKPSGEPLVTVIPHPVPCPSGSTSCGGSCVDTRTSSAHCGSCNYACPTGSTCQGGTCVCGTGLTACSLDSFSPTSKTSPKTFICANLQADESNCGVCGHACDSLKYCDQGECLPRLEGMICKTGHYPCSGVCVDLLDDEDNCGACGVRCDPGETCCNGVCGDLKIDESNCGSCGNVCGSGQTCTGGRCVTSGTETALCPSGCECLTNDGAAEMFGGGSYTLCSEVQETCGFEVHADPSLVSSTVVTKYCFRRYADCPAGCGCLLPGEASAEDYTLCGAVQTVCGGQWVGGGSLASVKSDFLEKYCYLISSPVPCAASCSCMDPAKAAGLGLTSCGEEQVPCDSDPQQRPYFCYKPAGERPEHCANGCSCLNATKATAEGYTYCGGEQTVCGEDPAGNPRHCVERLEPEAPVQAPQTCAAGCSCRAPDEARAAGYVSCGRTQTLCGYDASGNPLYCFSAGIPPAQSSAFPERGISVKDILRWWTAPARGISVKDILGSIFGRRCSPGETLCNDECVDLRSSASNCGACGVACASNEVCHEGECRELPGGGGIDCPPERIPCGQECFNPQLDESHCGNCETVCPAGYSCIFGQCSSPDGCLVGTTSCDGDEECYNLQTSESHCGNCETSCDSSEYCINGVCGVIGQGGSDCRSDWLVCGVDCVNPQTDSENCGACGTVCPPGRECQGGRCVCAAGTTECRRDSLGGLTPKKGWNTFCADLQNDADNCGACGNACRPDQVCQYGHCMCSDIQQTCNGVCVFTGADPDNCGVCNRHCQDPNPDCCFGVCTNTLTDENNCGHCAMPGMPGCPEGFTCCNGVCKNLNSDNQNCGTCGSRCVGGEGLCCNGICTIYELQPNVDQCEACGLICGDNSECCNGQCTDVQTDEANCGICGNVCASGKECCPWMGCADLNTSVLDCGACGHPCNFPNNACVNGRCCLRWGDWVVGCEGGAGTGEVVGH